MEISGLVDGSVIPLVLRGHYQAMAYVLAEKDGI